MEPKIPSRVEVKWENLKGTSYQRVDVDVDHHHVSLYSARTGELLRELHTNVTTYEGEEIEGEREILDADLATWFPNEARLKIQERP